MSVLATADEVEELSFHLGVDLFAYADDLTGESAEEKAGRLAAARDMLADDPDIYVRTLGTAARSARLAAGADVAVLRPTIPAALAAKPWLAGARPGTGAAA
ncbi:hypothetical protein OG618_37715 (plasmid) [Kitasatospora sp. NBC_01246]|uniref:hypothetical protein n=1 Tax=Kitasatospora sp. NBC_01246 TaxID=2903570 RepID=UPI002E32010A|nr:hypothetical protein [Kitasatospora sp. NBC_01246]